MEMIKAIKPYAYINLKLITHRYQLNDKYYFFDNCGRWETTQDIYEYLGERGIPIYEREYRTINS